MIRTIKELREAIEDLPDDNIIYAQTRDGSIFDILCVEDATSVGFWEIRLDDVCTAYGKRWQDIFTMFCHQCFQFWIREGYSLTEAHARAKAETLALKHDPFSPCGEKVDQRALKKWEQTYNTIKIENYGKEI